MRIENVESVKSGWDVFVRDFEVHVVPTTDLIAHEHTDHCACQPQTEPCEGLDGMHWLITHAAWDGRP